MDYTIISEGKVKLMIPRPELFLRPDGVYEPSWAPVFYNPRATLSRDLSVLVLASLVKARGLDSLMVADVLAGTGVRGIRYVIEVPNVGTCVLNDADPKAVEIIKKNVEINDIVEKVHIYLEDANILLYRLKRNRMKLDYIDIDPYGSPVPFVRSALWSVRRGGFIGLTATDVATLSGSKPLAGARKYDCRLIKTDFSYEVGLRILLGYIARRAAEMDRYIEPIIGFYHDYYYRVVIGVNRGALKAHEVIKENIGFIYYCINCLFRTYSRDIEAGVLRCPSCGSKTELIGPLWVGDIIDPNIIKNAIDDVNKDYNYLSTRNDILKLLSLIKDEAKIPYYYNINVIASKYKLNMPKIIDIINYLKDLGYEVSRTHFTPVGIKTNADLDEILKAIKHITHEGT